MDIKNIKNDKYNYYYISDPVKNNIRNKDKNG